MIRIRLHIIIASDFLFPLYICQSRGRFFYGIFCAKKSRSLPSSPAFAEDKLASRDFTLTGSGIAPHKKAPAFAEAYVYDFFTRRRSGGVI
jgi:hypothetical protein